MCRARFHLLVAHLCLICFGLSNTLLAHGLVICQDGHGGSRIEWGCDRNTSGECESTCGEGTVSDDPGAPHPCDDAPVSADPQVTKAPPRHAGHLPLPAPVAPVLLAFRADPPTLTASARSRPESDRPPDALRHVRTVVLLV